MKHSDTPSEANRPHLSYRLEDLQGLYRVLGIGFRVWGLGFGVSGLGVGGLGDKPSKSSFKAYCQSLGLNDPCVSPNALVGPWKSNDSPTRCKKPLSRTCFIRANAAVGP